MLTDDQIKQMRILDIEYANKPTLLLRAYNNAKTCVLVVDMCEGFCSAGALSSPLIAAVIDPIATMLDFLPNSPKYFLVDTHTEESVELTAFPPHCTTKKECAIAPKLLRHAGRIIPKNSTNGLFALCETVKIADFDNFIIVGCCTDICILQLATSLRALLNEDNLRANVLTFTDCTATYDAPNHDARLSSVFAFKLMETAGVKVFKKLV